MANPCLLYCGGILEVMGIGKPQEVLESVNYFISGITIQPGTLSQWKIHSMLFSNPQWALSISYIGCK